MKVKKNNSVALFLLMFLTSSCSQKPAQVVLKREGVYKPTYSEVYIESPDGKIARSLRGQTNVEKAQEISIINKDAVKSMPQTSNYYTVKSGDSLWSISRKYDMRVQDIVALNNLKKPYNIRPGQELKVSGNPIIKEEKSNKKESVISTYVVKSGDNLSTIANKNGMKTIELADLNDLEKPYNIRIGQKLKIKKTVDEKVSVKKIDTYIVKSGDNLSTIAQNNDMSLAEIASLNNLKKPYNLRVGQKLKINSNEKVSVAKNIKPETPKKQVVAKKQEEKKNSFIWPVKGEVISSFGNKSNGLYNDGINIAASKGSTFKATEDGVVAYVGNELRGYGTIVLIKHNDNWISAYAHCGSVKVARGDKVEKGQVIGTVGQTGNVSTPQLYFSLRSGREAVDPIKYLN